LTNASIVMGAALYISPEQARGDAATPASDVYSLAVVGYEMITGRRLFTGNGPIDIVTGHIEDEPDPLPDEVGERVQGLIARALRKDPRPRPQNGTARRWAVQLGDGTLVFVDTGDVAPTWPRPTSREIGA